MIENKYLKLLILKVFQVIGLNMIHLVMHLVNMLNALLMNTFGSNSMICGPVTMSMITLTLMMMVNMVEVHKQEILSYYNLERF